MVGSEDKWVVSPSFTMERIAGSGDVWWVDGRGTYPDGSTWFVAATVRLRDGKVFHERWIFGPPLEAPAWRSAWVERIDEEPA